MKFEKTLVALAVTATLNVAFAQKIEASDGNLDTVVISATRPPQALDAVAGSVSVLTADDFDAAQAGRVSDVMKKLPNVEFGGGPREHGEIPTIRGVSGAGITLLVDGARQNDVTSTLKSPLYINPYFLKQAEVLRGASSSLYGTGGNGGVMSFTTLSAKDLLEPGQTFGTGVKAAYGSANTSTQLNARVYGVSENVDGLIAVGKSNWNKIKQGGGTYLEPNDGDAISGLVKVGVNPTNDSRLELSHLFYHSDNLQPNNAQATDTRTTINNPFTENELKSVVQMTHVKQDQTIVKGSFGNEGGAPALEVKYYKTTLSNAFDPSTALKTDGITPLNGYVRTKTDTDGVTLQGTRVIDDGVGVLHKVTAGVDYFKDVQSTYDRAAGWAANNYESKVTRNGERTGFGLFVQDQVKLGTAMTVTPSLRSDQYELSLDRRESTETFAPTSNKYSRVSPKLAATWQTHPSAMLFASHGEGFRTPTITELWENLAFGVSGFKPNPLLRPEIDKTTELGFNFSQKGLLQFGDSTKFRAVVFNSNVTDLIYMKNLGPINVGQTTNCNNYGVGCNMQAQNAASASRRGFEIQAQYALSTWQFNTAFSRVRVENNDSGEQLFSPPDKLNMRVRHALPGQDIQLTWNTTAVAAQDYDSTVLRRRPGYALHDAFATWTPAGKSKYRVDFGVTNLFDKRYSAYQSSNKFAYTYQEGRSAKVALTANF